MKTASPELVALLASNRHFTVCDLYTIVLTNGTTLRHTSADINVNYGGHVYSKSLKIDRQDMKFDNGISVDTLRMTIRPSESDLVGTIPMLQAFRNGTFDGAILQIDKAFFTSWETAPLVLEKLFLGKLDVEEINRHEVSLEIKSMTELLNIDVPKVVYQSNCPWVLYDSQTCKADKSANTFSGTIQNGSDKTTLVCNLAQANGYFDQGVILFNSGANLNVKRTIKAYTTGNIVLVTPLLYNPVLGDTFVVYRGCNRSLTDCANKFSNSVNFGGKPYIPVTETVY